MPPGPPRDGVKDLNGHQEPSQGGITARTSEMLMRLADRMGFGTRVRDGDFDVLDTETTGTNPARDTIWQISMIQVRGFNVQDSFDRIIRISREDFDNAFSDLRGRDDEKRAALYEKMHLTWDRIETQGLPVERVLSDMAAFCTGHQSIPILGHNVISFDFSFLSVLCNQNSSQAVNLDLEGVLDTGVPLKAAQVGREIQDTEQPLDYMRAVAGMRRRGVYWSIQWACERLGIDQVIDLSIAHDALADCKLVALVIECLVKGVLNIEDLGRERVDYWLGQLLGSNTNET